MAADAIALHKQPSQSVVIFVTAAAFRLRHPSRRTARSRTFVRVAGYRGVVVSTANSSKWYHSTVYNTAVACESCGGTTRPERWCRRINAKVRYAFDIATHAEYLTREDDLRLHALGIAWRQRPFYG